MKIITFKNVEDLVFRDKDLFDKLPIEYKNYRNQWKLAQQFPSLRQLGKKAMLDFLNKFPTEQSHQKILEDHFGEKVSIQKLNYNIVENYKVPLDDVCDTLCDIVDFGYYETSRDKDYLYISFWR